MTIMYLSKENFTCHKEQIIHKKLSKGLTVLKAYINSFEKGMESGKYSVENSMLVEPDQLALEEAG